MPARLARKRLGNASSFSQAGIPHSGNTQEQKSGRQTVADNPFPRAEDRIECAHRVLLLRRFSATVLFQRCPLRLRPGRAVSRRRNGEATAGPNGTGPSVPTIEEPGRCQRPSSLGTAVASSMRFGSWSFLRVRSTLTTQDSTATNVGANLEGPLAVASYHPNAPCGPGLGAEGASWTSLKERPPGTIRGSDSSDQVGNCPL